MNNKAQTTIEAMVSFAAFLALLGLFLSAATAQKAKASEGTQKLFLAAEAKKCAAVIDSMYSNGTAYSLHGASCFSAEKNQVSAKDGNREKSAFVFAPGLSMTERSGASYLEVKLEDHYR